MSVIIVAYNKTFSTFVSTVPVLLPVRSAHGSFFTSQFLTQDNTPSMPLFDAHLEGFFINSNYCNE